MRIFWYIGELEVEYEVAEKVRKKRENFGAANR
jgi:hypothetical protein